LDSITSHSMMPILFSVTPLMLNRLIASAFETGCLSVESEALIRQVLATRTYRVSDLERLQHLWDAVQDGRVKREATGRFDRILDGCRR
jgi:hypothetical protein